MEWVKYRKLFIPDEKVIIIEDVDYWLKGKPMTVKTLNNVVWKYWIGKNKEKLVICTATCNDTNMLKAKSIRLRG